MGLQKSIELESGIQAEYFNINSINLKADKVEAIVSLYVNKSNRDAGKLDVHRLKFEFNASPKSTELCPFAYVYGLLKTHEYFVNAIDA